MNWEQSTSNVIALREKADQLKNGLQHREGLAAETEAELGDQIQGAAERAILIESLDRSSALLREVLAALMRIEDGSYGLCLRCSLPISTKRLAAVPWAALCIGCQEEEDREHLCVPARNDSASILRSPSLANRASAETTPVHTSEDSAATSPLALKLVGTLLPFE